MKQLPADVVEEILNNALWSRDEECILADIRVQDRATIQDFQRLLDEKRDVFHKCRTATTLRDHWQLLRHYNLLNEQTPQPPQKNNAASLTLAHMESKMADDSIDRAED